MSVLATDQTSLRLMGTFLLSAERIFMREFSSTVDQHP